MPTWTVHLEGGPRRVNHAAIAVGEKVFSFGGYCTGDDYENTRPIDVHVLNTVSFRWCKLPLPEDYHFDESSNIPYQRYGHTAVAYKGCAYIWGGRNDKDGACAVLFCFDTDTRTWSRIAVAGDVPGARDGHSSCVVGDKMYIFGGYEEEIDRFSNDIHYLDFTTWRWSGMINVKGKPAMWRDFHTASTIGHHIYIFGGRSDVGGNQFTNREIYENIVYTFNTLTNTWESIPTRGRKPIGRRSHSTFELGGCLYVFGGYNGLLDQHFSDLFKYDPENREWSLVLANGDGPCPRRRQCCCVIGSRVFLFGGTSPSGRKSELGPTSEQDLVDHSDLHVLDFAPSLKTLCLLATLKHKLDHTCLPQNLRWELKAMTTNNTITRSLNNTSG